MEVETQGEGHKASLGFSGGPVDQGRQSILTAQLISIKIQKQPPLMPKLVSPRPGIMLKV
jgi:hypothetical protein